MAGTGTDEEAIVLVKRDDRCVAQLGEEGES